MMFITLIIFVVITKSTSGNMIERHIAIEDLEILKSTYVHMKNTTVVFEKINKIISQGADKLQLVTDFDGTVTKQHDNNTKILDSFAIFYKCKQLPQPNLHRINVALSNFAAVNLNTSIPIEQRKQVTSVLYETVRENFRGFQFDQREIEEVVRKYGPSFRDRTDELFSKLKNLNIPVTLFSAGLSDVIIVQFHHENIEYDNVNIISNHLKFSGTMLDGFENPISVHTFNKYELLDTNSHTFKSRKNVILMGDHTGDATMVNDLDSELTVLRIGFFYGQTEDNLKIFKETFDIVLDNDQTMNVILDIIKLL